VSLVSTNLHHTPRRCLPDVACLCNDGGRKVRLTLSTAYRQTKFLGHSIRGIGLRPCCVVIQEGQILPVPSASRDGTVNVGTLYQ
jgi:hypothetical protein